MTTSTAWAATCASDPTNLTVDDAPAVMQTHLYCTTATCKQRRKALDLLVAARRYVLEQR